MIETLKFPSGDFTHSELATFNGKTNQQVWTRYQVAIKDGTIVSAGTRPSTCKGKPSKLWRLSTPSQSVPAVATPTPAVAPAPVVTTPPAPAPVIVPTEAIVVPVNEPPPVVVPTPVIESPPIVTPVAEPPVAVETPVVATAPVETPVTVEVLRIEAPAANPMPEVKIDPVAEASKSLRLLALLRKSAPFVENHC